MILWSRACMWLALDTTCPPRACRTASGLVLAAFACLIVLPFIYPVVNWRNFVNYLERDLPWLVDLVTLAILSGLVWLLPRLPWLRIFPPVVFMGVMIVIVVVGGITIVRKRRYFLRLWHFEPTVANQRRILVLALAALYLGYSLVLSPLSAAAMLFIPLLVWSAVRYRLPARRKLWAFVFGGWSVLHGLFSALFLAAVLTSTAPWSLTGLFAFTLISAQWLVVLVYVFSTPPLGVIERR
jgi:hypothetical protein